MVSYQILASVARHAAPSPPNPAAFGAGITWAAPSCFASSGKPGREGRVEPRCSWAQITGLVELSQALASALPSRSANRRWRAEAPPCRVAARLCARVSPRALPLFALLRTRCSRRVLRRLPGRSGVFFYHNSAFQGEAGALEPACPTAARWAAHKCHT